MSRITKTVTISLPPQIYKEIEEMAKLEQKTKSELFRDMIRVYEDLLHEQRWRRLRKMGREISKKFDITSEEDVEKIVHDFRQTQRQK
jgi:CopG family transcriptional regulator/antitoxin EndoAI